MFLLKLSLLVNAWYPQNSSYALADSADFCEPTSLINISTYTILSAVILGSVFMLIIMLITSSKTIISKIPMWVVISSIVVLCLKLFVPIEFTNVSFIINSTYILPFFNNIIFYELLDIGFVKLTLINLFCIVWATGATVLFLRYIVTYLRFSKITRNIPQTDNEILLNILKKVKYENNFNSNIKIIENNFFDFPFESGLLSQSIFINKKDYTEKELYYILTHELTHIQNKSNWIKTIVTFLGIIYWWNPIVYFFKTNIENLLEIFVDKSVVKRFSHKEKAEYMKCVYNVFINNKTFNNSVECISIPMVKATPSNTLFNRFKIIAKNNKNNMPLSISILLITLLFVFVSGKYQVQPCYEPPDDELYPTFDDAGLKSDDTYIIIEDGSYVLYYEGERLLKTTDINSLPDVPIKNK